MPTVTGLASSFITFSRPGATGGGATTTLSNGRIGWAGHNLLTNSESFDASAWGKVSNGSTSPAVTANAASAPDGTSTADKIDFGAIDAAGDYSIIYRSLTLTDATYTGTVYVKAATAGDVGKKLWLYFSDTATRGVVSVTLTSDWQTLTSTSALTGGADRQIGIATFGSTSGGENQGAVSAFVWGAHLYRSDLGGMQQNPAMPAGMGSYYPTTPKNLLGNTEAVGSWTAIGTPTITANTDIAPNGLQTADTVSDTNASGYQGVRLTYPSVNGGVYTGSIHIKKTGATSYPVFQVYKDSTNTACGLIVNVAAGTVAVISGAGYAAPDAYNIVSVGDYWRVWIRVTATSTSSAGFDFYPAASTDGTTISSSATGSAIIWGAQLSDSASLDTYVPSYGAAVTSAAYYAPRLDFDGATLSPRGLLVEEQRTNILQRTAEFDNVYWSKSNSGASNPVVTANSVTSPDGTTTADKIEFPSVSGAGAYALVSTTFTATANANTASIWLRGDAGGEVIWIAYTPDGANFSRQSCTLTTSWQRFSLTATLAVNTYNIQFGVDLRDGSQSAKGAQTIYAWGAQLEQNASFATSYIPNISTSAGVTRTADVASVSTQAFPYSQTEGTFVVWASANQVSGYYADAIITENIQIAAASNQWRVYNGTSNGFLATLGTAADGVSAKVAATYTAGASASTGTVNGGTVATYTSPQNTSTIMRIGGPAGAGLSPNYINGHIRQITYLPRRLTNAELQQRTSA